ncbi:hypothetical protein M8J76_002731 [Diaphorina citri]|nr:hypothetical protein M8J76_002731 [Diaphorina citri]
MWDLADEILGSESLVWSVDKMKGRNWDVIEGESLAATSTGLSVTILARTIIKTSSQAERFGFVFLKFLMSDRNPGHLFSNGETLCIEIKTDNPTTIKQLAD